MIQKKLGMLLVCAVVPLASGCVSVSSYISNATVSLSPNLETLNVTLVFTNAIESTYSGAFNVDNYGEIFVDPYTPTQPFQVGFALDTSIVNDQSYINLTPTTVLPNGMPIPVSYPLVQIMSPTPINSEFNLYGYVDVTNFAWIGASAIFSVTDQYFPSGLSVSETFLTDSQGNPELTASAFGPVLTSTGSIKQAGGVALFANVKELVANGTLTPEHPLVLKPTK